MTNKGLAEKVGKVVSSKRYKAQFLMDGNYTVCLITNGSSKIRSFGIAKRNPNCDEFDEVRGREISLARAVKKL